MKSGGLTFFIAHAGKHSAVAERLYDALHPEISCFLARRDLLPGQEWDLELPKAQRRARATVVLIEGTVDEAYYLREEITAAIDLQRADPERHRLVPVYRDGRPSLELLVPYGLRVRHALDMRDLGFDGVVAELKRLAASLQGDPGVTPALTAVPPPAVRLGPELYDALTRLRSSQFEAVAYRVGAPRHQLAPESATLARRALDLVLWADQGSATRLEALRQAIRREAPGLDGQGASARGPHETRRAALGALGDAALSGSCLPALPELVVGREADIGRISQQVAGIGGPRPRGLLVIRGWPGVGKTTLLQQLAYEPALRASFPDGVLWAALGETGEPGAALASWARAMGIDPGVQAPLPDRTEQLRSALTDRRVLLLVDDVWVAEQMIGLRVAGPGCATVLTTRFTDVASQLAPLPERRIVLDCLDASASERLLRQLAPRATARYPRHCAQLCHDLEGLPLALRIAAALLEDEIDFAANVDDLFHLDLLDATAPLDRTDPRTGTTPTLRALLRKSTDRLDEATRNRFAYLGALAPKPATFDLEVMARIWRIDDARPTARRLVSRGLLEPIGAARFQIHAVLVLHARELCEG